MKKIITIFSVAFIIFIFSNSAKSADVWVYGYQNGNNLFIVYESVKYGIRTNFYAKFRIKRVNKSGELIKIENWEIGHDEGDWWYGVVGESRGLRVYDYEESTEIFRWLKNHEHKAHNTAVPYEKVLSD